MNANSQGPGPKVLETVERVLGNALAERGLTEVKTLLEALFIASLFEGSQYGLMIVVDLREGDVDFGFVRKGAVLTDMQALDNSIDLQLVVRRSDGPEKEKELSLLKRRVNAFNEKSVAKHLEEVKPIVLKYLSFGETLGIAPPPKL